MMTMLLVMWGMFTLLVILSEMDKYRAISRQMDRERQ
jgi:succinate-acetate transporter protein